MAKFSSKDKIQAVNGTILARTRNLYSLLQSQKN